MGAQSSVEAQGDAPQSSMRPGWPQGQPPDMVWGSDRGLQATLQDGSVDDLDAALLEAVADGDAEATAALLAAGANVNHLSVQHDWASPAILAAQALRSSRRLARPVAAARRRAPLNLGVRTRG